MFEGPSVIRDGAAPGFPVAGMIPETSGITSVHHYFEAGVDRRPAAPAIISGETTLSYAEVEQRANQIARYLRYEGVKTGDLVGLFLERSPDAIVAILAILKAGAAYIPLDPSHPADRIRHIIEEASIKTLVSEMDARTRGPAPARGSLLTATSDGRATALGIEGCNVVTIDDPTRPWQTQSTARLSSEETGLRSTDLCYVLYTSGSTGKPKGVMTEHRNLVSFVAAFNHVLRLTSNDRVFQGFSLGFDGSVEETWMAFSNGAALVVPPRGAARFGSDLALLITSGGATVFSTVPTSLAMISEPLPTVNLLIVSGERCPKETVNRWAVPERRMLNVYGPTETTVNATVAECRPDRPVTIGVPLPGYHLHILDEKACPVTPGEKGELFITGPGVARGYLGQPALTQKQFVDLAVKRARERAYRTGDLVSLDDNGELLFHGRMDSQVKVRGYRIELSEIEAVLGEHDAIQSAAVTVTEREGTSELCAFVVAKDPARGVDRNAVLALLTSRLPVYMIPAFFDVLEALPTLASGKVNRKRLPAPVASLVRTGRTIVRPSTPLESQLLLSFSRLLHNDAISIDDDFFAVLGGYSLLAARLVSDLRRDLDLDVALRDIYDHPTIAALAAHLAAKEAASQSTSPLSAVPEQASSRHVFQSLSRVTRAACVALQALSLYAVYAVIALPYLGTFLPLSALRSGHLSFAACACTCLLVWAATLPVLLALSVVTKWLFIGRYRPGRYPLWGWYYLRFWLVRRFQLIAGSAVLAGTPLLPIYLRAMGAKVGKYCTIDTANFAIMDLLTIGEDTSIGSEAQLLGYRVEDGYLFIGSIEIGSRSFVGVHSAVGLDAKVGDDARLDDLSLLPDGGAIASGKSYAGSPARPAEVSVPNADTAGALPRRRPILFGFLHLVVFYLMNLSLIPVGIPGWLLISWAESRSPWWLLGSLPVVGTATVAAFCLWTVVLKRLIFPRATPGIYRVESGLYLRKWAVDYLMALSRTLARPLYTTIYLPPWLRLLGAKIGRRAEISTVSQISPELTHIGEQSFFADGSMICGRRVYRGLVELAESRIGRRSFVGNGALLPTGASLGDRSLLGCLSVPPPGQKQTADGSEWLGSPSFALPNRPKHEGFDESVTHEPTRSLIAQRLLVDALRIMIPSTLVTGGFVAVSALAAYGYERLPFVAWLLTLPLLGMAAAVASLLCVVATKKILIGTFTPTVKPLWSMFVWLNEAVNGAYETVAAPVLTLLLGTPYSAPWFRMMGCKIGRHVYLETTLFSEFDLVDIGDHAALNAGAVIQNHLFEDRVMKISSVKVGEDCSVGSMAVVLYDTEMQAGSSIGPLSLLMKGETLPPRSRWAGIPTARVSRQVTTTPASPRAVPATEAVLIEGSM